MELRFGVARLPDGKRKAVLWEVLDFTLARLVGSRVLPFDEGAAIEVAGIAAEAETASRPIARSPRSSEPMVLLSPRVTSTPFNRLI